MESRLIIPRLYGRVLRLPSSVVFFALIVGGELMGIIGAIFALPVAAAVQRLVEELRVELLGEKNVDDGEVRARDEQAEREYEARTDGEPGTVAAAIAVEISATRRAREGCEVERGGQETRLPGGDRVEASKA